MAQEIMAQKVMAQKIVNCLWFADKAEEAAGFYVSVFPNSHIDGVHIVPGETPSGPEGAVYVVEFTLDGQQFMAMKAGSLDSFNHAISQMIVCETQDEIDHYWSKLGEGGSYEECGWLKDKYGVVWQVTPRALLEMEKSKDREAARRAIVAMMEMKKLDIAALQKAFEGK
jgi:predicted 3-demethylubiquinone-9 3-methyltransferase (glyoxalase superfamily)